MLIYLVFMLTVASATCCKSKPNFVIFLTDDQDVALGGMDPMKNVKRFIADKGVTYTNSFVSSPICCPSRASFLTGLYVHNHLTVNNSISGGCYGRAWKGLETRTFASALHDSGYSTFYAGKYLNAYGEKSAGGPEVVPPGWSEWHGLVGNSVYYNYTISNNGVPTHSTDLYLTDIIRDLGVSYIENQTEARPFLMVLAPPAPHQPFTPAPRHKGTFSNVTAIRHPNFNIAVDDKHWLITMPPSPLPDTMLPELDRVYRSRWESLLAVDEMVADVVNALENRSLMENTYVIYTSDNGYHIGQFSQVYDKRQPYETDIKVPLIIKGPGVKENIKSRKPVINIDLAPTIINLAGLKPPKVMDGRPIELKDNEVEGNKKSEKIETSVNSENNETSVKSENNGASEKNESSEAKEISEINETSSTNETSVNAENSEKNETSENYEVIEERTILVEYYGEARDGTVDPECPWRYDDFNLAQCYPQYDCKCQDSRNNTFGCLRHIAERINMKYCLFADNESFTEIYNLAEDPYELRNIADQVLPSLKHWYKLTLARMLACRGSDNCDNPLDTVSFFPFRTY